MANLTNLSAVAFDMGRAGFAPEAHSQSRVEVNTDNPVAVTLNALPPSAALRLDGTPSGSADPDGSATLDVPVGAHTITVLPEPSGPLALAVGAALVVGLRGRGRGRNRIALCFVLALLLPALASARTPIPSPTVTGPVADAVDNCPQRANPGQEDTGGIANAVADGIGNACQCGDVTANGVVNGQDANAIQRHGLGLASNPLFVAPQNCDVSGNGQCNGQDANAVRRAALGLEPNPLFGKYACESAQGAI